VKDITQFLVDVLKLPPEGHTDAAAAVDKESCDLARLLPPEALSGGQGAAREFCGRLRDRVRRDVRADWCCGGMAGSFSTYYYDLSKKISDKKVETIKETGADYSSCRLSRMHDSVDRQHHAPQGACEGDAYHGAVRVSGGRMKFREEHLTFCQSMLRKVQPQGDG